MADFPASASERERSQRAATSSLLALARRAFVVRAAVPWSVSSPRAGVGARRAVAARTRAATRGDRRIEDSGNVGGDRTRERTARERGRAGASERSCRIVAAKGGKPGGRRARTWVCDVVATTGVP